VDGLVTDDTADDQVRRLRDTGVAVPLVHRTPLAAYPTSLQCPRTGLFVSIRSQVERIDRETRVWLRKDQRNVPWDTDPSSRRWKIRYTISTGTTVRTTAANSAPKSTA
jgi:hypothetical protein